MNKTIKFLVWFLLATILISGCILTKRAFAAEESYIVLSHQYNRVFANLLIKKINILHKNFPVILYLKNGSEVVGIFKSYNKSDESVWIKQNGHIFQVGYGVTELEDIRVLIQEPI